MPGRRRSSPQPPGLAPNAALAMAQAGVAESRSRFLAFLEVSFDVVYDWDVRRGLIDFNEQMSTMLGLPPGVRMRRFADWLDRLHPRDRAGALENLERTLAEGARYRDEYRLRREDGTYILIDDHGLVLNGTDGRPAHMVGAMRDVTREREAEKALRESEQVLRTQAAVLEERNTALRVILEQREQDRVELEKRMRANIENLIHPTLDRLERLLANRPEVAQVQALRINLDEIVRPFGRRLGGTGAGGATLTRRELEVAGLVRHGRTTDEIAAILRISRSAVSFHRGNIRRKLGLARGGPHLTTYLSALAED